MEKCQSLLKFRRSEVRIRAESRYGKIEPVAAIAAIDEIVLIYRLWQLRRHGAAVCMTFFFDQIMPIPKMA